MFFISGVVDSFLSLHDVNSTETIAEKASNTLKCMLGLALIVVLFNFQ